MGLLETGQPGVLGADTGLLVALLQRLRDTRIIERRELEKVGGKGLNFVETCVAEKERSVRLDLGTTTRAGVVRCRTSSRDMLRQASPEASAPTSPLLEPFLSSGVFSSADGPLLPDLLRVLKYTSAI